MEVRLIDKMGSDITVVNAARVSFHKESKLVNGEPLDDDLGKAWKDMTGQQLYEQVLSEGDQKLIKYLAAHNHWTPFSHVQITLREKVPIFVARQRFKHMVGFTYNEISRRYVDDPPEFFIPDVWRGRAENKKQGSDVYKGEYEQEDITSVVDDLHRYCLKTYNELLQVGVAPEQARMVLPQSMYTEFYSTGSLVAWARMINLRKDSHAQKEIQDLARMCDEKIRGLEDLKYSWGALVGEKWY